jgi:hypothetical protein
MNKISEEEIIVAATEYGSHEIKGHLPWIQKDRDAIKSFIDGAKWMQEKLTA